jgi:hypothetical protein
VIVLFSLHTHSFNVDLRGDIDRQMAAAEAAAMKEGRMAPEGQSSATAPKHTWWWRLAHVSARSAEQHAAVQGAFCAELWDWCIVRCSPWLHYGGIKAPHRESLQADMGTDCCTVGAEHFCMGAPFGCEVFCCCMYAGRSCSPSMMCTSSSREELPHTLLLTVCISCPFCVQWRKEAQPATPSGLGDSSNRVKLPSPSSMV